MHSNLHLMENALKDLLLQNSDDAFVIFSEKVSGKFVQFVGSAHENLALDLPIQTLSENELNADQGKKMPAINRSLDVVCL